MNATKKQFQLINGVMVEQVNGSIPTVEWVDANGNTFRAFPTDLLFFNSEETYIVKVRKQIKPSGLTEFIPFADYQLIADTSKYRNLTTGLVVDKSVAVTTDENGNETINPGFATNGKFFTIMLGYNVPQLPLSVFNYIYSEIAEEEGVTLVS